MLSKLIKKNILSIAIIVATLALVACNNNEKANESFKNISTSDLKSKLGDNSWVVVDTRLNDSYNGWALDGIERGGHIEGAVDFSANWLKVDNNDKEQILDEALKNKKIDKDKNIVLYDYNGKDSKEVATYLSNKGYKNLYTYNVDEWAKDKSLPMKSYENYSQIVPASIVKELIDGKKPDTFKDAENVRIIEASWGEEKEAYAKGHVPTSIHINTDIVEPPPYWMLADDKALEKFALEYGFKKDDTVIVTGPDPMPSYRIAVILRYIGVEDVRVLNGGNEAWLSAGYKLETKSNKKVSVSEFGAKIPANPDLIDTIPELKEKLKSKDYTLVDDRTWDEFIGKESGYSYHDKKGRIPGAVYGYSGSSSTTLEDYRNIDNTMRNADEIKNLWKKSNIDTNKHLIFMCGSGWRAAEVLTFANVMGIEKYSLYSDGWIGWSNDHSNPTETGDPK